VPWWRIASLSLFSFTLLFEISGCAILGRRGKSAESVAAARELSRQGVAALESGQSQQAEELLKKSLAASPDDASAQRYMAEALWQRGSRAEAVTHIEEAIRLEPNNAVLAVRAGEMSLASGRTDAAIDYAEKALRMDPKSGSAWALRGRCFSRLNQPDRALADLQRAVELSPQNSDLLLEIAQIYRKRGQNVRCLTAVYHVLDTYSPGEEPQSVLTLQGVTLLDLGRPQQASDVFLTAIQHGPPSADLYSFLAQSYSDTGRVAEATEAAQRALAIDGTHDRSRKLLALLASRAEAAGTQRR
jgi:tetratricopeptide (TPR) repeat protein